MNDQPTYPVLFNKNEIEVLLNLLDVATKAAGRSACQAVFHFEQKFNAAMAAPSPVPSEVPSVEIQKA